MPVPASSKLNKTARAVEKIRPVLEAISLVGSVRVVSNVHVNQEWLLIKGEGISLHSKSEADLARELVAAVGVLEDYVCGIMRGKNKT